MIMKKINPLCLIAFTVLVLMAGCQTENGQQGSSQPAKKEDKRPLEERLRVGMTKEEVRAALGEPGGKSTNSAGLESWRYSDNAKMWIPFYAIGGGKFKNVTVNFDADGKVKDWNAGEQGIY